jgi:hypothetical protein
MMARPASGVFGISSRRSCHAFLIVTGLVAIGCALSPSPQKMYEGPPLPKEQIGILHSGCRVGSGLTIMTTQIDGKDIADGCADFALSPGEHHIELSAKQLSPKLEPYVVSSGTTILGRSPAPMGTRPEHDSQVIWASTSPLRITCRVQAGQEVIIVGSKGVGEDWLARCQEHTP